LPGPGLPANTRKASKDASSDGDMEEPRSRAVSLAEPAHAQQSQTRQPPQPAASYASPPQPAAGYASPPQPPAGYASPPQPPPAPSFSLAALTAHVSGVVGTYCRVVVGDARFRADVLARISDVVVRWMATRPTLVALYGRRAWNVHLAQTVLEETTTDFDIMALCGSGPVFETLRYSLLAALHSHCPDLTPIIHAYLKPHQDGRGATMTVEVGGAPLVDLSVRDQAGDFCIGSKQRAAIPGPHTVTRIMEPVPGRPCAVSVLRRAVMRKMLRAEIQAGIWRADKARKDLARYAMYEAVGWFLPDYNSPDAIHHQFVITYAADSARATHPSLVSATDSSLVSATHPSPNSATHPSPDSATHSSPDSATRSSPDSATLPWPSVQLQVQLLGRHLRSSKTMEECRRCAGLVVYERGDAVHKLLVRILAASHVGEVCRIMNESEREMKLSAEQERQRAEQERQRAEQERQRAEQSRRGAEQSRRGAWQAVDEQPPRPPSPSARTPHLESDQESVGSVSSACNIV
jgi:hypothetical protein